MEGLVRYESWTWAFKSIVMFQLTTVRRQPADLGRVISNNEAWCAGGFVRPPRPWLGATAIAIIATATAISLNGVTSSIPAAAAVAPASSERTITRVCAT